MLVHPPSDRAARPRSRPAVSRIPCGGRRQTYGSAQVTSTNARPTRQATTLRSLPHPLFDAKGWRLTSAQRRDVAHCQRYLLTLYFLHNRRVRAIDGRCGVFSDTSDCLVGIMWRAINNGLVP